MNYTIVIAIGSIVTDSVQVAGREISSALTRAAICHRERTDQAGSSGTQPGCVNRQPLPSLHPVHSVESYGERNTRDLR